MKGCNSNSWKGFVLGVAGSVAGLMAMAYYWQIVPALFSGESSQGSKDDAGEAPSQDISLIGKQYREDESSTAALGRIIYGQIVGQEPRSQETKTALSYLVHWVYGMLAGGVYGAIAGPAKGLPTKGGLAYGTALWLYGDEAIVPLMGLQAGPSAVSPAQHAHRLGAHLAYGLGTAAATQLLQRLF
ncbi:MAG TPA: hypothetical protein VEC96_16065 [Anaerolineae bacterium]|nr:hypothetical protein [Anaerolineae bacterium]